MKPMIALCLVGTFVLAGCATRHEPGWTGQNARPFGEASARCAETAGTTSTSDAAFVACMLEQGWSPQ